MPARANGEAIFMLNRSKFSIAASAMSRFYPIAFAQTADITRTAKW
jgi:hypothetical protein